MSRKPNKTARQTAATQYQDKHALTLYFDTEQGLLRFRKWYLDEGGEQLAGYYAENSGKTWMYVKPPDNACPYCEYWHERFDEHPPKVCPDCEKLLIPTRRGLDA